MTAIVIHAGMPKAGSSSVQQWLATNATAVRGQGFTVAVSHRNSAEEIVFSPYEGGAADSGWIAPHAMAKPVAEREQLAEAAVAALASAAERYGNVVVSSESFSAAFWRGCPPVLAGLQRLAELYDVRIAYYSRPQHTSLEAGWRQWGFRSAVSPATYVEAYAASLHYADTRRKVRAAAPAVDFEPRPFRPDMLDSGDVVGDFAARFLGIEVDEVPAPTNRGLPLEVANVLQAAPPGMFWDGPHDNERLEPIKRLYVDARFPDDDRIRLSRQVLRKYAFDRFADENAELGWDDFVPPPDDCEEIPGIDALDALWQPSASPGERQALFEALRALLGRPR